MDWEIKKRGRVTYYRKKTNDVFSDLVVEKLDNGDLKIRFVGMTGAVAASNELGLDEIARMDPAREIPRIFDTWEMYVREAGLCNSLAELDFLEVHSWSRQAHEIHSIEPLFIAELIGIQSLSLLVGCHAVPAGRSLGEACAITGKHSEHLFSDAVSWF